MNQRPEPAPGRGASLKLFHSQELPALLAAVCAAGFTLGLCRTLSETFPLALAVLAGRTGTIGVTVSIAALVFLWQRLRLKRNGFVLPAVNFIPLLLPLVYVFRTQVDLLEAYVLLTGSAVLTLLTILNGLDSRSGFIKRFPWESALLVLIAFSVYLATLGRSVGQADTFEFQVTAPRLGIAHPTGYPLYLILGKLFSLLPVGSIAFRVNLLSAACAAVAVWLLYCVLVQLLPGTPRLLPVLGAWAFAFSTTFWSQAVEAEVYALNCMIAAFILWVLTGLIKRSIRPAKGVLLLFMSLGLGLANHLTTVILFPAAALALVYIRPKLSIKVWLAALALFLAGLAFYLYLPIRWPVFNQGSSMGMAQFADWVFGGRFKGALNLSAWRTDAERYAIVARLILEQWQWPGVLLAVAGLGWLFVRNWRFASILLVTWAGYAFYGISYYVPDLSVFLIPVYMIVAVWIVCGVYGFIEIAAKAWDGGKKPRPSLAIVGITLFSLLPVSFAAGHWPAADRSGPNPLEDWGRYVLGLDLDKNAAILADSEKIAPLYYLQQSEGLRPDLDIMVLPDEQAYRAELDARIAAGQSVYLARYLPGLEGVYHLSSAGPLVKVSAEPVTGLPELEERWDVPFGPTVTLLGRRASGWRTAYPQELNLTLYWTTTGPVNGVYQVQLRLVDGNGTVKWKSQPTHPAGNAYPTSAWKAGEIIADAHQIQAPASLAPGFYQLQVALIVPFGEESLLPGGQTDPWWAVGHLDVQPPKIIPEPEHPLRIWLDDAAITGAGYPMTSRPETGSTLELTLAGKDDQALLLGWDEGAGSEVVAAPPLAALPLVSPADNGEHTVFIRSSRLMRCGWLQPLTVACPVAQIDVQGAMLPEGVANFTDLIALLKVDTGSLILHPGGSLAVTLEWLALAPVQENYTLFIHVLDQADTIVGQVDTWPGQGTYPTGQWAAGTRHTDRIEIPISSSAAPGPYRLEIGWYLLGDMRRLAVLGPEGQALDDRVLLEGLVVPE